MFSRINVAPEVSNGQPWSSWLGACDNMGKFDFWSFQVDWGNLSEVKWYLVTAMKDLFY